MLRSYKKTLTALFVLVVGIYTALQDVNTSSSKDTKQLKSSKNILALSWHNNFCRTHTYKKECKATSSKVYKNSFVLHGLWPQPRNNVNCTKQKLQLDKLVFSELKEVMPGVQSYLHQHEWKKHGTCYSEDANRYFVDSIKLTKEFNELFESFFKQRVSRIVSRSEIAKKFNQVFFKGAGRKFRLICKKGRISEIRLNLRSESTTPYRLKELLKNASNLSGGCQKGLL